MTAFLVKCPLTSACTFVIDFTLSFHVNKKRNDLINYYLWDLNKINFIENSWSWPLVTWLKSITNCGVSLSLEVGLVLGDNGVLLSIDVRNPKLPKPVFFLRSLSSSFFFFPTIVPLVQQTKMLFKQQNLPVTSIRVCQKICTFLDTIVWGLKFQCKMGCTILVYHCLVRSFQPRKY